jgi:hypothetical protein
MPPTNPYASPASAQDQSDSTWIDWEDRRIEIRGAALASQLWSIIQYTIAFDATETFSNTQIRGTDEFDWQFTHQGRAREARFEPIGWPVRRRQPFRIHIDGNEIACDTVTVRGFGYYIAFYTVVLLLVLAIIPAALMMLLALVVA